MPTYTSSYDKMPLQICFSPSDDRQMKESSPLTPHDWTKTCTKIDYVTGENRPS